MWGPGSFAFSLARHEPPRWSEDVDVLSLCSLCIRCFDRLGDRRRRAARVVAEDAHVSRVRVGLEALDSLVIDSLGVASHDVLSRCRNATPSQRSQLSPDGLCT